MEDLLFADQRQPPTMYDVEIQGKWEKTVSIRVGVSWPGVETPGYYVLVAQLDPTERELKYNTIRLVAFAEGGQKLLNEFFRQIGSVCNKWRVDYVCHGEESGEESFSYQLHDYLRAKEERYEIIQRPWVQSSWRCKQPDFLVQLVRDFIVTHRLILFRIEQGRTPQLIDRIRNTDMESDLLKIPELKALAHVLDDFECSPWRPPQPSPAGF